MAYWIARPTPTEDGDPCLADMGKGVTCQRPLHRHNDPIRFECAWGHIWWIVGHTSRHPIANQPTHHANL